MADSRIHLIDLSTLTLGAATTEQAGWNEAISHLPAEYFCWLVDWSELGKSEGLR
jgi:hypothetical protein